MKHHNYYVYIVLCSDGSYYTGVTNDLDRRFAEHVSGDDPNCYTFKRRPLILKYYEYFRVIDDAIIREKQIKRWSRAKKQALVNEDANKLTELSKSYTKINYSMTAIMDSTSSP